MPRFIVWVSFPIEIEAAGEEEAIDLAVEAVEDVPGRTGDINTPSVEEIGGDDEEDEEEA